jgi:hypothetical protein
MGGVRWVGGSVREFLGGALLVEIEEEDLGGALARDF